jgi:hypothetical protein
MSLLSSSIWMQRVAFDIPENILFRNKDPSLLLDVLSGGMFNTLDLRVLHGSMLGFLFLLWFVFRAYHFST